MLRRKQVEAVQEETVKGRKLNSLSTSIPSTSTRGIGV
jgi:hypothetical protein